MYLKSRGDLNRVEYSVPQVLRGPGSRGAGTGDGVMSRGSVTSDLFLGLRTVHKSNQQEKLYVHVEGVWDNAKCHVCMYIQDKSWNSNPRH